MEPAGTKFPASICEVNASGHRIITGPAGDFVHMREIAGSKINGVQGKKKSCSIISVARVMAGAVMFRSDGLYLA
jgi:hypothetical protein